MVNIDAIGPPTLHGIQAVAFGQPECQAADRRIGHGSSWSVSRLIICPRVPGMTAMAAVVNGLPTPLHAHAGLKIGQSKDRTRHGYKQWIRRVQAKEVHPWHTLHRHI